MTINSLDGVSKERILKELTGMFSSPYFVSKGLPLMLKLGIEKVIPGFSELFEDLKSCTQNPDWHAEGSTLTVTCVPKVPGPLVQNTLGNISGTDFVEAYLQDPEFTEKYDYKIHINKCGTVYDHTMLVMEEMSKQLYKEDGSSDYSEHDRFILMMTAMLHDIGKPVSARKNGPKNPGDLWGRTADHDVVGAPLAYDFCKALGMTNDDCEEVSWLVKHHMRMHQIEKTHSKCKRWRLISNPLFDKAVMLARADERGCRKTKDDLWRGIDNSLANTDIKELIGVPMPARILNGDYIISKGYTPGPTFKKALDKAYEFQINDNVTDPERLFKLIKGILKH